MLGGSQAWTSFLFIGNQHSPNETVTPLNGEALDELISTKLAMKGVE
jgi:hypothetical protein